MSTKRSIGIVLADPSLLQKIWDKGVDITASVISSTLSALIAAVLALIGWRIKLWLDLRANEAKLRQEQELKREFERETLKRTFRERHNRLARERDQFVETIRAQPDSFHVSRTLGRYRDWAVRNELVELPGNQAILNELEATSRTLTLAGFPIDRIVDLQQTTALPPQEE
jgi:hypothetical protein